MSKDAERAFASRVDRGMLLRKPFNNIGLFREFAFVLSVFGERVRGGRILDVGCGPGWTSSFLARDGYRVLGVDISEGMIAIARERCARDNVEADFVVGDMEDFNVGLSEFDGALFFDCLHHCTAYPQALANSYAHLRPGGYVLLMETTWLHRFSPHARRFSRQFGVTELGFTRRQLRQSLRAAGFRDVEFFHDPGPCFRGVRGFLTASLRLACSYFCVFPRAKNIVVARKPEQPDDCHDQSPSQFDHANGPAAPVTAITL
jgi:SAM-dependent methyltransferase